MRSWSSVMRGARGAGCTGASGYLSRLSRGGVRAGQRGEDRDDLAQLLGHLGDTPRSRIGKPLVQLLPQRLAQGSRRVRGSREALDATRIQEIIAHRP